MWPRKTSVVFLWFAAAMFAAGYVPTLQEFHSLRWETVASVFDFRDHSPGPVLDASGASAHLIDPGHSLDSFYRALARAERGEPGAVVRVLHFGDSIITADQITADVRENLQGRFGAAGEGFVLLAKPWAWYHHRGIEMTGHNWKIEAASTTFARDGIHGLGGGSFSGTAGATARFRLPGAQLRMEVAYWAQPGGGSIRISGDSTPLMELSTASSDAHSGFHTLSLPPTVRKVDVEVTSGQVRLFGVNFENDGPGLVYDNLGLNAAQVRTVLDHFAVAHWQEQLRHYRPDLVVLQYGANESGYPSYVDGAYASDLRELIRRVHDALPETSVLIMSPIDRGVAGPRGGGMTMPKLPVVVEIQRRTAAELGCAFFNTFQAIGGQGTMARWYEERPRLAAADYMHLLPAGAKRTGTLVADALYQGYWNSKTTTAGSHTDARQDH